MKLLHLRGNVYYIKSFVNIGVIVNDRGEAVLVDAGLDEQVARRIKNVLDQNQLAIKGIILTHAHADHYGGARYLSEESGAPVYAGALEKGIIETPILEAWGLFGGAYPPAELRRKFFCAAPVAVYGTVSPGEVEIGGFPLEVVDLGGHTLGQIGIAVEKVLFCADSIATLSQIPKQGILKHANIEQTLKTCERLKAREELLFVPSHGNVLNSVAPLIAANQEWINRVLTLILRMTHKPIGVEELLAQICDQMAVTIKSLPQYYVLHLSLLAYLEYLIDRAQISAIYRDNKQWFQRRSTAESRMEFNNS